MINGVRLARKLLHRPELGPYFDHETLPGPDVETDDEIFEFLRQYGSTVWHLIGTSKMGLRSNPMAVVDDELRVHGVAGLRVVDASVMPSMPSANTYASTLMIAEKAADMIRGRTPLESASLPQSDRL
jgi:choline dehydrogenase